MRWKILLAVLLILGMAGLLALTPQGQSFLAGIGIDLSGVFTLFKPPISGNYFSFSLTLDKSLMNGMSFKLEDGSVRANGTYIDDVILGNSIREKKTKEGNVELSGFKGTVYVTNTIKIVGDAASVAVEGEVTRSVDKMLKVQIEIYPNSYFVAPVTENKIQFSSIDGKLERIGDGAIQPLKNDTIDISNFIGNVRLEDGLVILSGSTTQITGKTFSWKN